MQINENRRNNILVVAPAGRLDSTNAQVLERRLSSTIERGDTDLVIDLTALEYISSIGLSVLLAAAKKIKQADGRVALAGMNDRVRSVMEISGFTRLFTIYPSVETALTEH